VAAVDVPWYTPYNQGTKIAERSWIAIHGHTDFSNTNHTLQITNNSGNGLPDWDYVVVDMFVETEFVEVGAGDTSNFYIGSVMSNGSDWYYMRINYHITAREGDLHTSSQLPAIDVRWFHYTSDVEDNLFLNVTGQSSIPTIGEVVTYITVIGTITFRYNIVVRQQFHLDDGNGANGDGYIINQDVTVAVEQRTILYIFATMMLTIGGMAGLYFFGRRKGFVP
jgi:hypothetical protein